MHTIGHLGIDLGAKHAGTTAIAWRERGLFRFDRCSKGEDSDTWLRERVEHLAPAAIYIDAPLSLPAAYFGRGEDHFFRRADRLAGGMSPMFLGGLTARAIALAKTWRAKGIAVHEAYPAALVRHRWDYLGIQAGKVIPRHKLRLMAGMFELPPPQPRDRHEADAWLCWLIGHRHEQGEALRFGTEDEGIILA